MIRFLQITLFSLLTAHQVTATAKNTLCLKNEKIVFSCQLDKRMVSLCSPAGQEKTLIYRYGASNKIELVHPAVGGDEKGAFTKSSKPMFGGGISYVNFQRGEYEYSVYSKLGRSQGVPQEDRDPEFEDGIVIKKAGKEVKKLVCDDGGDGFRESIEWLPEK